MDSGQDKSKKKAKKSKKIIKISDDATFQSNASTAQEEGVKAAHGVMKRFLLKSEG